MNDRRGTDLSGFKSGSADIRTDSDRVKMWRDRIDRHQSVLDIDGRLKAVKAADLYITGKKATRKGQKVYCNYLLPMLEELHRKTLPAIPTPRTEAKTKDAEVFGDRARELIDQEFSSNRTRVKDTCLQLQWDDDRFGAAFAKMEWVMEKRPGAVAMPDDDEQVAAHVERAMEENAKGENLQVSDSDLDAVHLPIHEEALAMLEPDSPEYEAMVEHMDEHDAQMTEIVTEGWELSRVLATRYVWDTDVPWHRRTWEAELIPMRIVDMVAAKFRNVNEGNLGTERKDKEASTVPFEDRTASIWRIHDRENGKYYVVSAYGPSDGEFLKKAEWMYGDVDIYRPVVMRSLGDDKVYGVSAVQLALPLLDRLASVDFHIDRHVREHSDYKLLTAGLSDKAKSGLGNPDQRHVDMSPETLAMMKEKKPPPVPETLLKHRENLLNELRRVLEIDAQDQGAAQPHQISATESYNRAAATGDRKMDRQEVMGDFLAWVAETGLKLRRDLATKEVLVRVLGERGAEYQSVKGGDIPDNISITLDIAGETEEAKAEQVQAWGLYKDFLLAVGLPTDWPAFSQAYGRRLGIRNPETFQLPEPQGMGQEQPGQPGMPGQPNTQDTRPREAGQPFEPNAETVAS